MLGADAGAPPPHDAAAPDPIGADVAAEGGAGGVDRGAITLGRDDEAGGGGGGGGG